MEQVQGLGTTGSWLACLSAISFVGALDDDGAKLISLCPLAVAVVDLSAQQVGAMSPQMSRVLEARHQEDPVDLNCLAVAPAALTTLFDMVMNGTIDVYGARRTLRRGDDEYFEADVWLVVSAVPDRHLALWVIATGDHETVDPLAVPSLEQWPRDVPGLIVGVFGSGWRLETVNDAAAALTGRDAAEIIGRPLTDFVHPDDVEGLFFAVARTLVEDAAFGVRLRWSRREGGWRAGHAIITRLEGPDLRFGLAFSLLEHGEPDADTRVAALEKHLWRIARELEEAGVETVSSPFPSAPTLPGLSQLSARQWDVLHRLLRGERTATIAHDMFISPSTVRNHLSDIFKKLGVHSQGELMTLVRDDERRSVRRREAILAP